MSPHRIRPCASPAVGTGRAMSPAGAPACRSSHASRSGSSRTPQCEAMCRRSSAIAAAKFADGSDFSNYPGRAPKVFTREIYETADGRWLQFTLVRTEAEIRRLFAVLGVHGLLDEPRFRTPAARIESGTALADALRAVLAQRTAAEWMTGFQAEGVPASMVGSIHDLPDDPQLAVNGIVVEPVDDVGADYVINHPVNVDAVARVGVRKAPEVGEHTDAVLGELGYDDAAIKALRASGVV